MTLKKFISLYDKENSVVLLEGKRIVLEKDQEKLIALGRLLAAETKHILFRSGNADGADHYFSLGVTSVDKKRLQAITPYAGHRQKTNKASETISIDELNIPAEAEVLTETGKNKNTQKLINSYSTGGKNRFTIKAAYLLRDTIKATGTSNIKPASFGIFYDNLKKPRSGGTGYTMGICTGNNIPVIDQRIWFKWLEV